jgi:hypothetical protein
MTGDYYVSQGVMVAGADLAEGPADLLALDHRLAELTLDPDVGFAERRQLYDADPRLKVPPVVYNAVRQRPETAERIRHALADQIIDDDLPAVQHLVAARHPVPPSLQLAERTRRARRGKESFLLSPRALRVFVVNPFWRRRFDRFAPSAHTIPCQTVGWPLFALVWKQAWPEGGKSGLHGDAVPVNGRRGRPQGQCHRKHTANPK